MYPIYRRSEYGILEGGHNFTPDRLHNEYLNNMATKGFVGSMVYYIGVIIGWYLIVLRGLVKLNRSPMKFFALAFMSGATVYMGQVLFNFGVVATMVLFYTFMGLAWAIVTHSDFEQEQSETL
jgi:O-antigen ligase